MPMVNGHSANQKNGEENGGGSGRVRNDTTGSLDEGECHVDPYYQKKHLNTQECGKVNVDIGEFDSMTESRLLVLYTGGTIGMRKVDGTYRPAPNYLMNELRKIPMFNDPDYVLQSQHPNDKSVTENVNTPLAMPLSKEGRRVIYTVWEYDPLLDSCNMTMTDWARLAIDLQKNYHDFDGFVILHGTDTMAYTASALSFMMENLGKPVIITGSQIPIFETRSDGRDNFLGALVMAGHYCIPEVTIYFNNKLMRGNRATKVDAGAFDAFHTPNLEPLAKLEIDIFVNWTAIFQPTKVEAFRAQTNLCPNVGILRLFPSITLPTVRGFLQPPMEGVVIQTYGAGNGPDSREDLLQVFNECTKRGVIIVNITQCSKGCVSPSYATGKALQDAGIIPGLDMTPEAALTKLSYILGKTEWSLEKKREMMATNLYGEMRVVATKRRHGDTPRSETGPQESLLEFPLLQKMKDTMRLSSTEEVSMLKSAIYPALLCAAAREANLDALKALKESGAHYNQSDYDGRTALHVAASEGNADIVRYLLANGALLHQRDRYGQTPIDDAIHFNHHVIIRELRKGGAHLNVPPFKLGTLLCNAVVHRDMDQIKSWHLAGANINQGDYDNRTALHVACSQGDRELVDLLLSLGGQAHIRDIFSFTCVDEAKRHGFMDIYNTLVSHSTPNGHRMI